ncbi:probable N-acetyltransferase HLS1 isoform X2 [Prosopis cineraria]|uniref:probable N-acetyltransferase HLS1 isoform X2 n=1 Tax=Prosopis cineraria TaxID=364024 RepID=UPI0024100512|nr:probable N-acetyltransferase HLS1 isoform X2 [Prosopis cineraria]
MSLKIAAESWPKTPSETAEDNKSVVVKEYDEERHKVAIEKMESLCEVGQRGKTSLITDLMGDPICRIRHFPIHIMLVAEYGEEGEVVGVIRGCVKTVARLSSVYVKVAYLLGLRVCPTRRRLGIGTKLVEHLEEWCKQKGAKYAYIATDCTNEASINLFTKKCGYSKFRTLTMLVQPVHAHYKPVSSSIAVVRLPPWLARSMYNKLLANSEFHPQDIGLILSNKLNLGTFMSIPKRYLSKWDPKTGIIPPNFAMLSVWNTKEVFKLQVKGISPLAQALCAGTRLLDSCVPCLKLPSFPDVFKPFGVYFLYGLHMEGKNGRFLMRSLCEFVHNMARDDAGCEAVVAELGQWDPVREAVPHWNKFSWAEDMWCIKKLEKYGPFDWITSRSSSTPVIFVDPRDF